MTGRLSQMGPLKSNSHIMHSQFQWQLALVVTGDSSGVTALPCNPFGIDILILWCRNIDHAAVL